MGDLLKILLQAELESKNLAININKQLKIVESQINRLNIDINIKDADAFKVIENLNKELTKIGQTSNNSGFKNVVADMGLVNKNLADLEMTNSKTFINAKGEVDKYIETIKQAGFAISETFNNTDKGKSLGLVIDDKTMEHQAKQSIKNAKEQQSAMDKRMKLEQSYENWWLKSLQTKETKEKQIAQRNLSNINKERQARTDMYTTMFINLDKEEVELRQQIELYKQQQSIKMQNIEGKYKGLYDVDAISKYKTELKELSVTTPDVSHKMKQMGNELRGIESNARNSKSALDLSTKSAMSFGESLKQAATKFALWSGVTVAYYGAIRAMRAGIVTVKEFDTAMVELRKVTDETEATYDKFMSTAFKMGKTLSRTGKEAINATSDFARMGFTLDQSMGLAYEALLMLNVGDNIGSLDDATSSIIATLKGFNVEGSETVKMARYINDAYNEVANTFAVSTGDLVLGVSKTSAVLNQAGNSFDEAIGMLTGAFEVLQDMNKVSSGINIITQRLKSIGTDGQAIDGLAPKLESAFNTIGLTLNDTNGELKDTYDILNSLAKVFPTITKEQQNYISELVSGKRQSSVLMSLMSNWASVQNATETSLNSVGSAMIENEKYIDSIEGKVQNFASTVQMFWVNLIDTSVIKGVVDFGTWFMEMMIDTTSLLGGLGTVATLVANIVGVKLVWSFRTAYIEMMKMYAVNKMSLLPSTASIGAVIKSVLGFTTVTKGATIATAGLTLSTVALTAGLILIPMALTAIVSAEKRRKKAMEESIEAFEKQKQISSDMGSLIETYKKLAGQSTLTAEEQQRLLEVKGKITQLIPQTTKVIDNESLSLEEQYEILKSLNEEELKHAKIKAGDTINKYGKSLEKNKATVEALERSLANYNESIGELLKKQAEGIELSSEERDRFNGLARAIEIVENGIGDAKGEIEAYNMAMEILSGTTKEFTDANGNLASSVEDSEDSYEGSSQAVKSLYENIETAVNKFDLFEQALYELNTEGKLSEKTFADLIKIMPDLIEVTGLETGALIDLLSQSGNTRVGVIMNELAKSDAVLSGTLARIKAYEEEAKALESITNATALAYGEKSLLMGYAKYTADKGKIEALRSDIAGRLNGLIGNKYTSKTGSGGTNSSSKDEYKSEVDRYAKINLELDKTNVLLAKNKTLQDLAGDDLAKKIPLMEEEVLLNIERQKSLHSLNEERRKEMVELQKTLSGQGFNFEGEGDNKTIANLDNVKGKTKEVEEQFKRYIDLQSSLLPQASQEWWNLKNNIEKITTEVDKLLEQHKELARQKWIKEQNDLYEQQQDRLKSLEAIQETIVAIIRKRGEEEKKALDKAHQEEMDSLEVRHQDRKKKYSEELDDFKKLIQGKIDEIEGQSEAEDYLEQLSKERDRAVELQSEIDTLSLDDTLQARNKVIDLRKQLADQNEKISKMQQKKERDILKKSLQDQLKDKEEQNKEIEIIADNSYDNEKKRLEEDYKINQEYHEKKYSDERIYAEASDAIMRGKVETSKGVFEDIFDAYKDFENKFGKGMGILGDIIKNDFLDQLKKAQDAIKELDYLSSNQRPKYDSGYQPKDDEMDYKSPTTGSSGSSSSSSGKLSSMTKSDYEKLVNYKQFYDNAKRDGNKEAMNSISQAAQAIRGKYGITSDNYSYNDLKDLSYEDMKKRGYKLGGKITDTGTLIAPFHGTQSDPEWILRDYQLQKLISEAVLSTIKVSVPKVPTKQQGVVLQIENFIKADNITKDSIPMLQKYENDALKRLNIELNKVGILRPAY